MGVQFPEKKRYVTFEWPNLDEDVGRLTTIARRPSLAAAGTGVVV